MDMISQSLKLAVIANQNIKERDYWLAKLAGDPVKTILPYDFRNMSESRFQMDEINFRFPAVVEASLMKVAKGSDVKIHMLLIAGLTLLLNKYTGRNDILFGSSIFRQQSKAEFLNTILILRFSPDEGKSFKDLLMHVRDTLRDAELHQNYPMSVLPEKLGVLHVPGEFPFSDVVLLLENLQDPMYIDSWHSNLLFLIRREELKIFGVVRYNRLCYEKKTVERIIQHYALALERALVNSDAPLTEISILGDEERETLLNIFNAPGKENPPGMTFQRLFRDHVLRTPDAAAVIGPCAISLDHFEDNGAGHVILTFRELDRRASSLAFKLRDAGVGPDNIVGIRLEKCIEMFIAIIAVFKAGGAYLPLDPSYPENRISYMLENADARWLLTRCSLENDLPHYSGNIYLLDEPGVYSNMDFDSDCDSKPSDLAYVIFTSGTTGRPKGVLIQHDTYLNTSFMYQRFFKIEPRRDHILQVASFSFDVFAGDLIRSFLNGAPLFLCPLDVLGDFVFLYELMSSRCISYVEFTPAVALPLMRYIYENRLPIDRLRVLNVGADVILVEDFNWLVTHFGQHIQVINSYGITEATIDSSYYIVKSSDEIPAAGNTPIGKPLDNTRFYILNNSNRLQPIGLAGELFVGGDSLARGYLNLPELTAEKFVFIEPSLLSLPPGPPLRLYRTGDLARWLPSGDVDFLGRIDHQIKIRGFRIETGEIENCMLKHPMVKQGVIIARENTSGDKFLCAWFVPLEHNGLAPIQLKEYMAAELPEYMVPSFFTALTALPLTPNGKIDRKALPEPEMNTQIDYVEPQTPIEIKIREIWQKVLGKERIGVYDNFFDAGGHSLKGIQITSALHKEFNVKVPLSEIFRNPTIKGLSQYVGNMGTFAFNPIPPAVPAEYYPCSSPQKRLFILHQMDPERLGYNVPNIASLGPSSVWDKKRLEQTFRLIIQRHESLRTSFHLVNGIPMQKIHQEVESQLVFDTITHNSELEIREYFRVFIRPFNLTHAPLMRVAFLTYSDDRLLLIMDMHHIVTDAVSMSVLTREFHALYNESPLSILRIQYKDYAQWLTLPPQKEAVERKGQFWLNIFNDEIPILTLHTDFPRPVIQSMEGDYVRFGLDGVHAAQLKRIATEQGTTLYSLMLSLFYILLWKLSGQEDIVIGSPVAGRSHSDLENLVGMFVNTLAMRAFPTGEKSFKSFFSEVNATSIAAFENQDYPFEELVERVVINRDAARNPLFDVSFSYVTQGLQQDISESILPVFVSKFDISLAITEQFDRLDCEFEYCTRLFKSETINRFVGYFQSIISSVAHYPGVFLQDIDILPPDEKQKLLFEFNTHSREQNYSIDNTLIRLFRRASELYSNRTSVVDIDLTETSYASLDERSDALAAFLSEKGVMRGDVVGIQTTRSTAMIIGILAILKTGAAYAPLNAKAPSARTLFMLRDCGVRVLLVNMDAALNSGRPDDWDGQMYIIDSVLRELPELSDHNRRQLHLANDAQNSSDFAYIIYTSGTTGEPKGVPISHANISPLLAWGEEIFAITPHDRFLQNLSFHFDWSVWEIFLSLISGASLYMTSSEMLLDAESAINFIQAHSITVFHTTPTQWSHYLNCGREIPSLCRLVIGAEKLSQELVRRSFQVVSPFCRVFNQYGPTEATIISTMMEISNNDSDALGPHLSSVPIGFNSANNRHYILDKYMKLCPIGVVGELCIAGDGLSAGYWGRPELTADKFGIFNNERIYKTGDLARRLSNGAVEFLGRRDQQVKIRGFRIELGEIEARLLQHPDIINAVVLALNDEHGDWFLCAYFVPIGSAPNYSDLRAYLASFLPDYMIPSYFIPLSAIPLNANGKLDRKSLPIPASVHHEAVTLPADDLERDIARIWSDILALPIHVIGRESCFFKLGGHSLRAAAFTARLKAERDITLPLIQFFRFSVLSQLADYLRSGEDSSDSILPSSIVSMNKVRKTPNVFFIHDGGGQVEGYVSIIRAIDFAACYGVRFDQSKNFGPFNISLPDLASAYIRDIRMIQPHGPFFFVGWSFGGTLAFEISRQLEQFGEEIGYLMIIDAPPPLPEWRKRIVHYDASSEIAFLKTFFPVQSLIDRISGESDVETMWKIIADAADEDSSILEKFRSVIPQALAALILYFDQLSSHELVRSVNRFRIFGAARESYFPPNKISAPIHYLRAENSSVKQPDIWETFTKDEFYTLSIPGVHQTVVQHTNAPIIANWIKKWLIGHNYITKN